MKKKTKIIIVCALVIVTAVFLTGGISGDYREVADLELISVIGIDKDGDNVVLTVNAALDSNLDRVIISGTEKESLAEAISELRHSASEKEPFFAHVKNLIIGEEAAKDEYGIAPYLDYIGRNLGIRLDTNVYIIKNGTARDFILKTVEKSVSISDMMTYMQKDVNMTTEGHIYTCSDISVSLLEDSIALLQAIELNQNDDLGENSEEIINPAGFAIVKDGVLIGFTSDDVTKGTCIIKNLAKSEVVNVTVDDSLVSLGIKKMGSEVEPVFSDGELKEIKIKLDFEANIEQVSGQADITDEKTREKLAEELEKAETAKAEAAVNFAKEINVDFISFDEMIKMMHPYKFNMSKEQWEEKFRDVQITVTAKAKIERSYDIINPISKDGKNEN